MISVAVTIPVIESESSVPVKNAGTVTGGVLLVTTSAVYIVCPISFSRLRTYVLVPSGGGVRVYIHVAETVSVNAPVIDEPVRRFVVELLAVHVRSIVWLFGTLPAEGTIEPVGLYWILVGVNEEFGSLQRIILEP